MSFIESVNRNIIEVCEFLDVDDVTTQTLLTPVRELHVSIPVKMDTGHMKLFRGFRVHHNDALGYTKGGIRFYPDETVETIRSLASLMTWKASLAELPLGGAKGGVVCDTKKLSQRELEGVSRGYIRAIADFIGPERDVPAPDVYTNPQIMAWMLDEYEKIVRVSKPGVITGKPLVLCGSTGRNNATAMGGIYVLREAAKTLKMELSGATFAVQGFGNAGSHVSKIAHDLGLQLVAASDSTGAIVALRGYSINPYELVAHKTKTGSVIGYPNTLQISVPEELLELPVDILIPSALECVITEKNADKIKSKIIVELANGPTTPEADNILYGKGIQVIPDFLANAGGVIVSHFENVQNRYCHYWHEDEVYRLLDEKITSMYKRVLIESKKQSINMRKAAFVIAVTRVVDAMKLRGLI